MQGEVTGNVLLRRTQYRWADDPARSAGVAQSIVAAKVANCRTLLLRAQREQKGRGIDRRIAGLLRTRWLESIERL